MQRFSRESCIEQLLTLINTLTEDGWEDLNRLLEARLSFQSTRPVRLSLFSRRRRQLWGRIVSYQGKPFDITDGSDVLLFVLLPHFSTIFQPFLVHF